jgi:hypothetical protein
MTLRLTPNEVPISEALAEQAVIELFTLYGWGVRRIREDIHNRDGHGLPDLLCTSRDGLQLWVEMKRPASSRNRRGHVRKAQKEVLTTWRLCRVPCCVADGADGYIVKLASWPGLTRDAAVDFCDAAMEPYDWWPA